MSQAFYYPQNAMPQHQYNQNHHGHNNNNNHHGGRSRRGQRYSSSHNANKHFHQNNATANKQLRQVRDNQEAVQAAAVRREFEAARSFDLEDDEIFCPWHLLTEDDLHSLHSATSDRSSSSSGSPQTSPLQPQLQPSAAFALSSAAQQLPGYQASHGHLKLHQPLAQRTRQAIPIVDPNSRHTSPPTSISPGRQGQKPGYNTRRW